MNAGNKEKSSVTPETARAALAENIIRRTRARLHHPVATTFFDDFVDSGLLAEEAALLQKLSPQAQEAIVDSLTTHVHKEKPVFIEMLGNLHKLDRDKVSAIAVAVDILWALSLIYDDMFDEDHVRSGVPTTWVRLGKEQTMRLCQEILELVLQHLAAHVSPEIAKLASDYINKGVQSLQQHKEIDIESGEEMLYQNYIDRNDFNGTFGIHALYLLAENCSEEERELAISFIRNLNLASQLLNDLKDTDDYYQRGYSDIRRGLVTVPIADVFGTLSTEDREYFLRLFGSGRDLTEDEIGLIATIVQQSGAVYSVVEKIRELYAQAEAAALNLFDGENANLVRAWIAYKQEPLMRYAM